MINTIATKDHLGFDWIDILSPDVADLEEIAKKLGLHRASVEDALQPDHLPKFEKLKEYKFVIFRFYAVVNEPEADTVQELTNKVAVFVSAGYLVTIRMAKWDAITKIKENYIDAGECKSSVNLFNELIRQGLLTFDEPASYLNRDIDYLEEQVFLRKRKLPLLRNLYFLKRKVDVIRRILLLSYDIIDHIDPADSGNEETRDIRDLYIKQQNIFDSLAENTNHLLGMYFNISSQRTNETIRVLTIFSVFFLPLTFIVGIYGMNFEYMPELRQKWGYPAVLALMLLVVVGIYIWFRQKKWL